MTNNKYLITEFDRIWSKIESGENITFLRFADGERAIMTGTPVDAQEGGWSSPSYISKLGKDLLISLTIDNEDVYYAISCPCCDEAAYYWYTTRILNKNITFANLWINANYGKFLKSFELLQRDTIVIANYRSKDKPIGNLNILKHYSVGDDCISFWENEAETLINSIKEDFGNRNNLLYVVSAGPMSETIIYALYKNNPKNTYIDFGSSIDKYYRGAISRPYMIKDSPYYSKNCWLPGIIDTNVSVVLTLYKRSEKILEQIDAILNQTIKPKEIIVFHDSSDLIIDDLIIKSIKNKIDNYIKVENNVGVWGRFASGLLANSKYVCFFDDDTIPGTRWIENCYSEFSKKEGLYGAIGIEGWEMKKYPYSGYRRWGWATPFYKTVQVDFVGHSWFLKKDWLGYMFVDSSEYFKFKYVAEDMYLSFALKKYLKINTYVPPHPPNNFDLFGSLPKKAIEYGAKENIALSFNNNNLLKMQEAINRMIKDGFKCKYYKLYNILNYRYIFFLAFPPESKRRIIFLNIFKKNRS